MMVVARHSAAPLATQEPARAHHVRYALEQFGIVAVEASACGMPVVGTAVGGLTDVIVDGETGFLMPSGNGQMLTTRLQQLVADAALRARLGAAARVRAESHFDAQLSARRIASHLHRAVGNVA